MNGRDESDHDGASPAAQDVAPEGVASEEAGAAAEVGETVEDTAAELARLREENREIRDRMLRIAADFENFRKRGERDRQDYVRLVHERILKDFLPVLDNLTRAVESARRTDSPAIVAGVDLVVQEFLKTLKKYGVEPIDAVGRPFDPAIHEALQQVESEDAEPGTVVSEVQRGYLLAGRVLRPSLVVVSTAPEVTSPGMRRQFD